MGNNYQRLFYIFKSMDNDLGNPTGYLKAEVNGENARLQLSLSNLSVRRGMTYQLFGISKVSNQLKYTLIGEVPVMNGRADLKLDTDTLDIGEKHLRFEDINIYSVIAKIPDGNSSVVCPLVAYRNGEVSWRKEFESALRTPEEQRSVKQSEITAGLDETDMVKDDCGKPEERSIITEVELEREELIEETVGDLSDLIEVQVENTLDPAEGSGRPMEISAQEADLNRPANKGIDEPRSVEGEENTSDLMKNSEASKYSSVELKEELRKTGENLMEMLKSEAPQPKSTKGNQGSGLQGSLESEGNRARSSGIDVKAGGKKEDYREDVTSKFEATLTSLYNQELESSSLHLDNDIIGSAERNFMEISSINAEGDRVNNELDINLLKEELDKSFEVCNPFDTRSKRFRWWKINSPGYLNNILFRNNIKTYLLFNPKVMLAHYKYRYIIFGIRFDKFSGRERLVCGVPGVYSIDENPFGNMGSWAQLEGYKPKYGAFGYWMILIDPRTGKLIKIK